MRSLLFATTLAAAAALPMSASAQDQYPAKPVTLVVPAPPGGTTDVVARVFAKKLQELLGQPFVVDNRAGANGFIGTQSVLRAPKDGYQLIVMSGSVHSFAPAMLEKMPFDAIEDVGLVSRLVSFPYVLVQTTQLPSRSLDELVQASKADPAKVTYASFGIGSAPHLITEWLKLRTGMQALHVPYKGGGQATTDLIGGQISMMFNSLPSAMPQIKSGQLLALGVTSGRRTRSLPNVPAVTERVSGFEVVGWLGLGAPKGTPAAVTDKLRAALQAAVRDPSVISQLETSGGDPVVDASAADFHAFLSAEKRKWDGVVADARIPKEKN